MIGYEELARQSGGDAAGYASLLPEDGAETATGLRGREVVYTNHALMRRDSRRIPPEAVQKAMEVGRVFYTRGLTIYVIGRKEVKKLRRRGIDISKFEGVQILCSPDGAIVTVYRNRDFRGLRFRGPRWSH